MSHMTGEFAAVTQSASLMRPRRTNTGAAGAAGARHLLSDARKAVDFRLEFWDGACLDVTLYGSGAEPSWHWGLFSELKELAGLAPDWDSYGAEPLSAVAVGRCINALLPVLPDNAPKPTVVPTRDGGLQLEWHRDGVDFEIRVPPVGPVSYVLADQGADEEFDWQGAPARHAEPIGNAIRRLSRAD